EPEEVRAIRRALRRSGGQVRLVEAGHVAVEERLVVQPLGDDDVRHGDERGGIGRRPDEDVLVGQRVARPRDSWIDAHDARALLLRELQVLERAGAEGAVARAPAPHDDEPRVDVVGRLAATALVVRLGAIRHVDGKDLGLGGNVRPQLRATAEAVEQPLRRHAGVVQHREAARARAVQDRGRAIGIPHAPHLARHRVERLVPADALELPDAARARPAQRITQAVGMVHALHLAEPAHARVQRRHLGRPLARIGADLHDAAVAHVSVDHAPPAAVVAAGAGDDGLARRGGDARCFIEDAAAHGASGYHWAMPRTPGSLRARLAAARERHRERHRPSGFGFALADSIDYLDATTWDDVSAGRSVFLQRRYLGALERACPDNLVPRYALIFRDRHPVAAVVMQIVTVAGTRFVKALAAAEGNGAETLRRFGYRPVESDPNMVLEIPPSWRTYDDYLGSLNAKYKNAARKIAKDLAEAGGVVSRLADVGLEAKRVHGLYLNVLENAAVRPVTLPVAFFPTLAEALGDDFRASIVRRGNQPVGFISVLRDGDTAVAYYIGFERAAGLGTTVYLALLHSVVADAIDMGCRRVSFGRTALEPKAGLGARPERLWLWARHRNPALNVLIRNLLRAVPHGEAPERNPFKNVPAK